MLKRNWRNGSVTQSVSWRCISRSASVSVLLQIRNLLTFLMATLLLFVWALNTYPFQPSRIIAIFCYGFVIWIVAALAYRFVALNRNGIVKRR